jgi:hypothetical protein
MKLYHGTSERVGKLALAEGLKPRKMVRGSTKGNWTHTVLSNANAVYLTDAYPLYFSTQASGKDDRWAIVEVDTDWLDLARMAADEDAVEQSGRGRDGLPKGWTMRQRTIHYRKIIRQFSWQDSLAAMGTCGYYGAIGRTAITRVAFVAWKGRGDIVSVALDPTITILNYQLIGGKYKAFNRWLMDGIAPVAEDEQAEVMWGRFFAQMAERGRDCVEVVDAI